MNSEKYHNKLVNADRVEQCSFDSNDYKGDLEPNEIFAIGLAETQGKSSGLKQWLLEDDTILGAKNLEALSSAKVHVKTERATYVFEYDSDDYTWCFSMVPVVCKITAKEFRVDLDNIPDPVLEVADDKLVELVEELMA